MKRPIVITGFMGCGKTQVARELARRLNAGMVDLDERITEREGQTPAQIITEEGEPAFRAVETNALRELMESGQEIIALGGGAWIEKTNRDLIDQYGCSSVWLDAPFDVCWDRILASGDERPLGKTREQAQALYDRRRPVYELARIHIQVAAADSLDDLVTQIVHRLHRLSV